MAAKKQRDVSFKTWRARKVLEDLEETLKLEEGETLDPIEGMARIASDPDQSVDMRLDAMKALAQYVYPKLGARPDDVDPVVPGDTRADIKVIMANPELMAAAQALAIALQGSPDLLRNLKAEPAPSTFARLLPPSPKGSSDDGETSPPKKHVKET